MAVDGGVAAAKDHAAVACALGVAYAQPVAMAPDAAGLCAQVTAAGLAAVAWGVHLKVTGQVARVGRVAPKIQGHGRNGLGADQFAYFAHNGVAGLVPGFNGAAQKAALHDAGLLRQLAVAANKGAAKVGAARDIAPPDVKVGLRRVRLLVQAAKLFCAPDLCLGRQWGAGGAQRAHGPQVAQRGQVKPGFLAVGKKRRARAKKGDARLGGKAP